MRAGLALAAAYLAVLAATVVWAGGPLRPLFDGFAPPEAYRWVSPPKGFTDNRQPDAVTNQIPLDPVRGTAEVNTSTADQQATVIVKQGSVAPRPPDAAVAVEIRPLDPATLGPLPDGLRPASNAYRVTLRYQPSGEPVAALAVPGIVGLSASVESEALLRSDDGRAWQQILSRPFGANHGHFGDLSTSGYFVMAARPSAEHGDGDGGSPVVLVVGLGLVPVVGGALLLRRRNRQGPGPRRRP